MIIAISGTPGTGKTTVAKLLARMLNAHLVSISTLVNAGKIKYRYERARKTRVVGESAIKRAVKNALQPGRINIVEGHVAHIIKSDKIFILRCSPPRLIARVEKKGWSQKKIRENLEAEMLDAITAEALNANKKTNVIEIDTSSRSARQTASLIVKLLNNHLLQKNYLAGKIDWTEKYKRYLLSKDYMMSA